MQAWEEKVLERNRGREEGERRIARMNRLLEDDRVEDIARATQDKDYPEQLYKEMKL